MQTEVEERVPLSELSSLVRLRDQLQKLRIAEGNRVFAAASREEENRAALHRQYGDEIETLEKKIEKGIITEVRLHPAWPWLEKIHGAGPINSAVVLGEIDITRCNTPSALWRFAGYGLNPETGTIDKLKKGTKRPFNARLKTMVYRFTDSQIKLRGPYRKCYDAVKHRYTTTRGKEAFGALAEDLGDGAIWTPKHIDLAARRKASKLFLSHLWQVWREAEKLPVVAPWIMDYGHQLHDFIDPWVYIETNGEAKVEAE